MAIPKIIHYCWFGGKPLPGDVKHCIRSWKRMCPEYEIVRWDETNYDVNAHPFTASAYREEAWAFVSDYARLRVAYDYGGFYLDTDVELLKNLDFLLDAQCCIGVQQDRRLCTTGLGFGCIKSSSVVRMMLAEYDQLVYEAAQKAELACPYQNNAVLSKMGYEYCDEIVELPGVTVFPCRYFDPIAPGKNTENLLCADTISIHRYSNSWGSKYDVLRRRLIGLFGVVRVERLKGLLNG